MHVPVHPVCPDEFLEVTASQWTQKYGYLKKSVRVRVSCFMVTAETGSLSHEKRWRLSRSVSPPLFRGSLIKEVKPDSIFLNSVLPAMCLWSLILDFSIRLSVSLGF